MALEFTVQYQNVVARVFLNEQSNAADKQPCVPQGWSSFGVSVSSYILKVFRIFSA